MKLAVLALPVLLLAAGAQAQSQPRSSDGSQGQGVTAAQPQAPSRPSGPLQKKVAPGLADYTDDVLFGEVWPGSGLSPRDRSLVVISALIATNKPAQLQGHLGRALDNGMTPTETSGVLTHLAFYAGWPNAVSALEVYDQVYTARKVDVAALQATRRAIPRGTSGAAPDYDELTRRVVFDNLWRRSDLSVRDRSLVTIAALTAMGDAAQLEPYLRRGTRAGLTRAEIEQALTHLAFYAGWTKANAALEALAKASGSEPQAGAVSAAQGGQIWRKGSPPVTAGPAANFTGIVRVIAPFQGTGRSRLGGATVSFQPGARSAWHRHPLGQLLVVTEGCGWTQAEGGPIERICAGDVAWIGPGEKHWHGATPTMPMSHVAASESVEGQNVEWLEKVSDAEYARGPR
ncbi:MAG TPA: carboxymuconolactone decarboxylase family protein [Allosphingosinicella sp.]|jgi:4-carboxymuconolactone decarboxylase